MTKAMYKYRLELVKETAVKENGTIFSAESYDTPDGAADYLRNTIGFGKSPASKWEYWRSMSKTCP